MYKRFALTLLIITSTQCLTSSISSAQSDVIPIPTVPPPGYLIIEEDRWYLLADEPGNNIARAREAFLTMDIQKAASELRKAAVQIRVAASNARESTRHKLIHSERELEKMAKRIEDGTLKAVDELDVVTARALHALSEYQYHKAQQAWHKKKPHQAGHFLRAAADNIEHAAARTEARLRTATAEIARESRAISGSLIEGTGYVIDDVGTGFERIGSQIEHVGAKVIAPTVR